MLEGITKISFVFDVDELMLIRCQEKLLPLDVKGGPPKGFEVYAGHDPVTNQPNGSQYILIEGMYELATDLLELDASEVA